MMGTNFSVTSPILLIPPTTTIQVKKAITIPVTMTGILNTLFNARAWELVWTISPIPKAAIAPKKAKSQPNHAWPNPFLMKYIEPPASAPSLSLILYFTPRVASHILVHIPTKAVSHIQTNAPGPPAATAVATPAILPFPIVAARVEVRAWKGVISPSSLSEPSFFTAPLNISFKA